MNVTNVFNDYERLIRPNSINGHGGISTALFTNQPRAYIWTNTFRF